jgi:hypothetical protein
MRGFGRPLWTTGDVVPATLIRVAGMARVRGYRLSRDAAAALAAVSARGADDVLAAAPWVADRGTQRTIETAVEHLADALRMLAAQSDYVAGAWPAVGSDPGATSAAAVPAPESSSGRRP